MKYQDKTREQLIDELDALRGRISELEIAETAFTDEPKRVRQPDIMNSSGVASSISTQTIDINDLFSRDVTTTGSFDIRGDIWATTFGKVLQALPIPALMIDRTLSVVIANQACKRISLDHEKIQDCPFTSLFPNPSVARKAQSTTEEVFSTRRSLVIEGSLQYNERRIWGRLTFRSIRVIKVRFVLVLIEDLTAEKKQLASSMKHQRELQAANDRLHREIAERVKAEQMVRSAKERWQVLTQSLPLGLAVINKDGTFEYVNPKFIEIFGYDLNDVPSGRAWFRRAYPDPTYRHNVTATWIRDVKRAGPGEIRPRVFAATCKDGTEKIIHFIPVELPTRQQVMTCEDITERQQMVDALRQSENRFRELAELLPQFVYEVDLNFNFIFLNRAALEAGGYTLGDLDKGLNALDVFIPENMEAVQKDIARVLKGEHVGGHEYTVLRKDGTTFPTVSYTSPIVRDNKVVGVRGVGMDITDTRKAEDQLRASLKEKEVLLREVHHRVKNNLSVICSLLNLQSGYATDEPNRKTFEDLEARVRSMSMAHEMLYQSENLARLDVREYVGALVDHLVGSTSLGTPIKVRKEIQDLSFGLDTAIPVGFILTELVVNCLKHAFPDGRDGEIRIGLRSIGEKEFGLVVRDDGVGMPEGIDPENPQSLGLDLVNAFVEKLKGSMEIRRHNGMEVRVRFKEI